MKSRGKVAPESVNLLIQQCNVIKDPHFFIILLFSAQNINCFLTPL